MDAVERLMAIEEIKQLKSRYFRCVDTHDWAGLAQIFCRDAVFDCSVGLQHLPLGGGAPVGPEGPVTVGRDAIVAWINRGLSEQTSCHHGHGHEITVESPTEASGIVAMEDRIFAADRTTLRLHAAGHYHERYRVEDGAWRIAHTRLTRLFNHAAGSAASPAP